MEKLSLQRDLYKKAYWIVKYPDILSTKIILKYQIVFRYGEEREKQQNVVGKKK